MPQRRSAAVILGPFAVILRRSRRIFVISLRVNSAKNLVLCILMTVRDSSSSRRAGALRLTAPTRFSAAFRARLRPWWEIRVGVAAQGDTP
jgi:hypothetical protein